MSNYRSSIVLVVHSKLNNYPAMLSLKLSPLLLLSTVSHSHEGGGGNGKASAAREVMTNLIHTYVNDYVIPTHKNKQ